jgi:hypothetical protein
LSHWHTFDVHVRIGASLGGALVRPLTKELTYVEAISNVRIWFAHIMIKVYLYSICFDLYISNSRNYRRSFVHQLESKRVVFSPHHLPLIFSLLSLSLHAISLGFQVDPKLAVIPDWLISFFTRQLAHIGIGMIRNQVRFNVFACCH